MEGLEVKPGYRRTRNLEFNDQQMSSNNICDIKFFSDQKTKTSYLGYEIYLLEG